MNIRWLPTFLRNLSFQRQLSLAVSAGMIGIALFSSLVSSWQGSQQIRTTLLGQGQRIAETLAHNSKLALLYGSPDNVAEAVNTTLAFPDVVQVEIVQANGQRLLLRGIGEHDMPATPLFKPTARTAHLETETSQAWQFVAPVVTRAPNDSPFEVIETPQELLGYVRIAQSKATLTRMMTRIFLTNLMVSLFFAALFLLLTRALATRLIQPITALSRTMARAEAGDLNIQATLAGSQDIADMAKAFNSMMLALQERELALRKSEEKYREVIESVREVVFQTDAQGNLIFLNPAWQETTGYRIEDSLGQSLATRLQPDNRTEFLSWQERIRRGQAGAYYRFESRFIRADGSTAWLDITQRRNADEAGHFTGTSGTLDDITDRIQAELALKTLNVELEMRVAERTSDLLASNRELEAFSYSVSHDLRAPLRSISGFASILLNEFSRTLDTRCVSYLERIRQSAHRMSNLIDNLISLARINRVTLYRQPVDLSEMTQQLLQELRDRDPAHQVNIDITPAIQVNADPTLMRVMLDNLLSNAWKYSAQKKPAHIMFSYEMQQGHKVFFVRDNGAGFDMAHAEQLFRPFSRLHAADKFSGTGIGLATVRRVVERHGGRVWAEATINQGATFYFTLSEVDSADHTDQ